ncbi:MAG: HAMP domain-containing protein [Rhodospirillales bacterium]|nr:HAMP domain-containing protein [Rhodospirillales bacterium]
MTAWNWRLLSAVGAPLLMWLIALVVAWVAIDRLVLRPTVTLQRVAAAFAAGRHDVRVPDDDDSPKEISELGRTVNMMADNLVARESELEQAVDDQRGLLKELHHRVKNNLQVIASLLNLQVRNAAHERERRALSTTRDRVYALARIHEQLYRGHKIQWVPLDQLLPDIAGYLKRSRPQLSSSLSVHCDIDSLNANTRRVVPIALLVTEVVSSALDQEVEDDGPRNLLIALKRSGESGATLTVRSDSRFGALGPDCSGLSFALMKGFVRQLGGRSHLHTDEGYRLTVHIPSLD